MDLEVLLTIALLISSASGHHFLRGCQDVDPKCALIDEVRNASAGGEAEAQQLCDIGTDHYCSKSCNKCPDSQNIVMLVGGSPTNGPNNFRLNPTFFSLNGSLPACLASPKNDIDSSIPRMRTPGLFVNKDGNPVMCLGENSLDECYEYDISSDSWSIVGSTTAPGFGRGWDYMEEVGLIMAGSIYPDSRVVELTADGGINWEHLAQIPWGRPNELEITSPCVVILDNNTVFFAGGADGVRGNRTSYCATYFLDLTTKTWTQGPDMTHCRYYHTCSMITNATSGDREIVVVGGWDEQRQDHCKYIQEVEIFDLDTQQWRNAADFPKPIARHTPLYKEDTFLIMGGSLCNGCNACSCSSCIISDTIYQYNKGNDTWSELSVKLPERRQMASAMFVENLC